MTAKEPVFCQKVENYRFLPVFRTWKWLYRHPLNQKLRRIIAWWISGQLFSIIINKREKTDGYNKEYRLSLTKSQKFHILEKIIKLQSLNYPTRLLRTLKKMVRLRCRDSSRNIVFQYFLSFSCRFMVPGEKFSNRLKIRFFGHVVNKNHEIEIPSITQIICKRFYQV